ncbi:MAG TPA: response regulator [Candidatus Methylacidiphilales bacterium]
MKIFVIDDSSFSRKAIQTVLKELAPDANVIPYGDGEEALSHFTEEKPDAMTVDIVMPKMQGLELIEKIRATGIPVKIVVITSDVQATTRQRCAALGAVFLDKPFTKDKAGVLAEALGLK